jgi:hypothetical protein
MSVSQSAIPELDVRGFRLETELAALFGQATVSRAKRTDVVDLNLSSSFIDGIADTADRLLRLKDNAIAQREVVNALTQEQSLALCMWVLDTSMEEYE